MTIWWVRCTVEVPSYSTCHEMLRSGRGEGVFMACFASMAARTFSVCFGQVCSDHSCLLGEHWQPFHHVVIGINAHERVDHKLSFEKPHSRLKRSERGWKTKSTHYLESATERYKNKHGKSPIPVLLSYPSTGNQSIPFPARSTSRSPGA